jgi:hypothetical protein
MLKTRHSWRVFSISVASEGFEPPKSETADLQSDPFGLSGALSLTLVINSSSEVSPCILL